MRKLLGLDTLKKSSSKKGEMEITFAPALDEKRGAEVDSDHEETTLEKYKRKEKERKQKKKEAKSTVASQNEEEAQDGEKDDFFGDDSDDMAAAFAAHDEGIDSEDQVVSRTKKTTDGEKTKNKKKVSAAQRQAEREQDEREKAELALLMDDDLESPARGLAKGQHFDLDEILKGEKVDRSIGKNSRSARRKAAKAKAKAAEEAQKNDTFKIDTTDDRFKSLHQDHQFAIDPSNPR